MGLNPTFPLSSVRQEEIKKQLGSAIVSCGESSGDFWIQIEASRIREVIDFLRTNGDLAFDHLVDLCGVDYLPRKPRFEVVIHLHSFTHQHRIRVRVQVPDDTLTVPSLTYYWKAANWQEREAFDNYGIRFEGHPKLERILNAPDLTVFPQRKDHPLKGDREPSEDL